MDKVKYIPIPREVVKGNYEMTCKYCNTKFLANRSTAQFCSNLCRVKYNQEKKDDKKNVKEAPKETKEAPKETKLDTKKEIVIINLKDRKWISKNDIQALGLYRANKGLKTFISFFNFKNQKQYEEFNLIKKYGFTYKGKFFKKDGLKSFLVVKSYDINPK